VWLGLLLRVDAPAGIAGSLHRFAGFVALPLGWRLVEVAEVENLPSSHLQRAIIWDTARGNPGPLPSSLV
jgi:hypothetical protein